ncbi:MAG: hypothetical protein PVF27_02015 [Gemmatimonadales bacterium]|jgi:hypothetical protein
MQPDLMRRTGTWVLLAVAMATPAVHAQESLQLRYRPHQGSRLHTLVWSEGTLAFGEGLPRQPLSDSVLIEVNGLESLTQIARGREGTGYLVEVRLDSARTRMRPEGGAWKFVGDSARSAAALFVYDDRLRVQAVRGLDGDSVPADAIRDLRSVMPGFEAALPAPVVAVGQRWSSDIVFPLAELIAVDQEDLPAGVAAGTEFVIRATYTMDSLVNRGADTLAFVSVHGQFMPMTVTAAEESGTNDIQVSGAFGGRLIWSTGWSGYVSGAVRTRANMALQVDLEAAGATGVIMRLDVTQRFQIRQ